MLQFHHHAEQYLENEPWKNGTKQPVNKRSLEKWRRTLQPGQIVGGTFRIGEQLSAGAFGDVFLGEIVEDGLPVVVKGGRPGRVA